MDVDGFAQVSALVPAETLDATRHGEKIPGRFSVSSTATGKGLTAVHPEVVGNGARRLRRFNCSALPRHRYLFSVAQIFNLPYRRFVIGRTLLAGDIWQVKNLRYGAARPSRNQICSVSVRLRVLVAAWPLQQTASLRYGRGQHAKHIRSGLKPAEARATSNTNNLRMHGVNRRSHHTRRSALGLRKEGAFADQADPTWRD